MALNIKNREVERLAKEVAEMARETKTQAIRTALEERKAKLEAEQPRKKTRGMREYLEKYIWPTIPAELRGKGISKDEWEDLMG